MRGSTDPANVDQYDSRTYTRKGLATRVVVREKPYVKSRSQRLVDFLRPSMRTGYNVVQGFELAKVMFCVIFPVFMLIYWKSVQRKLPDQWESQLSGLQHRQLKEEAVPEHDTDYFSIIETFQERREKALQKKQREVVGTS
ncbi:uncharacterized protein TEOVI_000916500 [Trypanosoma equiperdum]|uniref:Uncharacterized protein n=3 Tax=Trypanozoon TaxID=39700 RepID=Q57YW8_TRYB2|nr:hypothetical protein, conserved [Trypanosoma brucei gambiense DAL972]XP_847176.1 hypothetical protein, conserved [Trypanosoma brucei brucei TREU927]AAX79664.1 hypothetical protein, conserved [Trypanosoma brucei]SCU66147.1 hypothetical protein, conserved [Trypanosoma equiperdum]AAZ13110.1 hypothetical protein, conserved [Trypanosoma brucei brucei TREU927]CBH13421.1 hypothetical protein, conserved [Trypanosoma brucei gambiense DAL972]|eukprot:XP_011775698.1 hypothetical protein, conserved [Trypanosoma brucei gambiense DAL972]